jgi:hypothetical protein
MGLRVHRVLRRAVVIFCPSVWVFLAAGYLDDGVVLDLRSKVLMACMLLQRFEEQAGVSPLISCATPEKAAVTMSYEMMPLSAVDDTKCQLSNRSLNLHARLRPKTYLGAGSRGQLVEHLAKPLDCFSRRENQQYAGPVSTLVEIAPY